MFLKKPRQQGDEFPVRDHRILTPRLIAGFASIVVVIIAARVINSSNLRNVYEKSDAVTHTYVVKAALDSLLETLIDAETGARGFVITAESGYLEGYDRAASTSLSQIADIRSLTSGIAAHKTDLDRLQTDVIVRLDELTKVIRTRRDSSMAAAQAVIKSNIGKHTMDDILKIIADMDAREDALLETRTAQAEQSYRSAFLTGIVTSAISLFAVLALFLSTRQSGKNRLRAISSAERLRVTLTSIGDAVIVTDQQGRVTTLNPVAEALTGWTDVDATGKRLEEVFVIINEESRLPAENPIGKVLRDRMIVGLANHTVLISKEGREIPVDDSAAPIKTNDGRVTGVIMVFRDVTERRRVERERLALVEAEREANRAKDDFLAVLSHELRTPLSSILGWATILRSGHVSAERAGHALEVIERNARVEAHLVESLLDLSRIIAGKLELEMERVDLLSLVRAAVDSIRPVCDSKQLNLEVVAGANSVEIIGDAARLQQILSNLMSNAVKFTPPNGRIEVRLTRAGSHAQIEVVDDGAGISADLIPYIFDRFRQAESAKARAYGGLGLGLAIVRELVNAHGGSIKAESSGKGHGSAFTVTLPIPAVMPVSIEAKSRLTGSIDEPSISGQRIIVVDDDADARELVALTLQSSGAAVFTACSSAEAWDLIKRKNPDILVSDIGMPQEDGYMLIQKLRDAERDPSRQRLPAIALTAYATMADREQSSAAGFDLHLTKPVSPHELTLAVAKFQKKKQRVV